MRSAKVAACRSLATRLALVGALRVLRDARAAHPVRAHSLIEESGRIVQLVPDTERAWHAGASRWGGRTDLNSASIGIELDNDGGEPFAEPQIAARPAH